MKINLKHLLLAALMTLTAGAYSQTIRRVNNNPGITLSDNMYISLQAAHDAANAGDTLYIEHSTILYGAVTLTKQLTIIGPGSWSDVYDDEHGQGTEGTTRVEAITFETGSTGSTVIGIFVDGVTDNSIHIKGASNLTLDRVRMHWIKFYVGGTANNLLISRCYLEKGFITNATAGGVWSYAGIVITNSILISNLYSTSITLEENRFFGTIENCLIKGYLIAKNFAINNNILLYDNSIHYALGASTLSNNVSLSTLGSTNGVPYNDNQSNVDMSTVFVVAPAETTLPAGVTEETRWQLKEGSPAIGAGIGGIDCGPYGGVTPYQPGGNAPVPTIYKFKTTSTGSQTTPLNVTISTKSNN